MKKKCVICGLPMPDNYKHNECKACKKKRLKEWWKKNWPWVLGVAAGIVVIAKVGIDNSEGKDVPDEDDFDVGTTTVPINEVVENYGGVPLSNLNELAKEIYHGEKVTVDSSGFLVFHYRSNSGKTKFDSQICINKDDNKLVSLGGHYPGQWYSSADDFVKKANELFFSKDDIT